MKYPSFLDTLEGLRKVSKRPVNEATYSAKNITPLLNKLGSVFGKQFGGAFQVMGPEQYKRSDGEKGIGYRMLNPQGYQMRINFQGLKNAMSDEFSRNAMYIKGIDYWDAGNTNWGRASLNVTFSRDCNILQIYKRLLALIKAGKKGKFTLSDLTGDAAIGEAQYQDKQKDRAAFLKSKGLKASNAWQSKKHFLDYAKEQGVLDEWYALIETGAPEVNSTSEGIQKAEKQLNEVQYSDPNTVFNDIESLTKFVANSNTARSLVVCGLGGVGKCQPKWGKIPTPNGWTTMGEVQVGDEVIAKDGTAVKVLEKYEQTGHRIYRLHLNDGQHLDVDDEQILHIELMAREGSKGIVNITLKDLREYLAEHPKQYATIPYCDPVSCFAPQELTVDPYFLGLLIGDGCMMHSQVTLTNADPGIITGVHKLVLEQYEDLNMVLASDISYRFSRKDESKSLGNPLIDQLRELGIFGCDSYTKFVPNAYKRGSIEQRMELLRGLMDSDGYIMDTGHTSYATCSKQLADDVVEIIRSLGGRACVREKHTKSQFGTPCLSYDVSFKLPPELGSVAKYSKLKTERYEKVLSKKTWCKKRKIESVEDLGIADTACILIDHPDHLYLMEQYIPIHNTFHITKALKAFGAKGKDWTYHGAMQVTPNSFFSTVFNERNKVICFDEADAILGNSDIVVMLKPLLDTSGDHRAEWAVQTAPMGTRGDDEIEGYCANFAKGVQDGSIDPVWSRAISDVERIPEFYDSRLYQEAMNKLISPESESEYKEAVTELITVDPDSLETALIKKLQDDYGLTEKRAKSVASSIADNFRTFLDHVDDLKTFSKKTSEVPTARYPSVFFFNGKMIFISNMPASKLDQAVMSRSLFVDVQLRATDIRNRIVTILDSDPSYDDVRDVLKEHLAKLDASTEATNQTESASYTSPELKRNGKQLTVRYMKLAADMIRSGISNWEELAAKYC